MRNREFEKLLTSNGFTMIRKSKHPIWSDGHSRIVTPTGGRGTIDRGLTKKLLLDLKKAIKARGMPAPETKESPVMAQFNSPTIIRRPSEAPKVSTPPPPAMGPAPSKRSAKEIWEAVKPMRLQKLTYIAIAERLSLMGYLSPSGKRLNIGSISHIAIKFGGEDFRTYEKQTAKRSKVRAPVPIAKATAKPPVDAANVIADIAMSNLSDETKRMLIKEMASKL